MAKSDAIITALKEATAAGVDTDDALDQLGELVEQVHAKIHPAPILDARLKAEVILSEVPLGFGDKTCVVGWDTCGVCHLRINRCLCKDGPVEPSYVKTFRAERNVPVPEVPSVEPKTDKPFSQQISAKILAEKEVRTGVDGTVCKTCHNPVTSETADPNDDGSWSCFTCQMES